MSNNTNKLRAGAFATAADGMHQSGLTKLEYAAVHIVAGLVANPNFTGDIDAITKDAVAVARALFAELEKEQ